LNASGRFREKITVETLLGYEIKTLLRVDTKDEAQAIAERKQELDGLKERFSDLFPSWNVPDADNITITP